MAEVKTGILPRQTLAQIFKQTPLPSPHGDKDWSTTQQINWAILQAKVAVKYGQLKTSPDGQSYIDLSFMQVDSRHVKKNLPTLDAAIKALAEIAGCAPAHFTVTKPLTDAFLRQAVDFVLPSRRVLVSNVESAQRLKMFADEVQFQDGLDRPEMRFLQP